MSGCAHHRAALHHKAHLLHQAADIVHRIVAGRIQFMNVQRCAGIKGNATVTNIAGFTVFGLVFAVDCFG